MKHRSKIWSLTDKDFTELVQSSKTRVEIMEKLGLVVSGGSIQTLNDRLMSLGLFKALHERSLMDRRLQLSALHQQTSIPLEKILVVGSKAHGQTLLHRLVKAGLKSNVCVICGQEPFWNGKPLVLQLDHKNGEHSDNRLENLQIVCPNCHTQTNTFCGKHKSTKIYKCIRCGNTVTKKARLCKKCASDDMRRVKRPELNELLNSVNELGYKGTGRKYGVIDNTIRKWIRYYNK
jgi:DNA-directed RNA polymerase subunit RPC12/RpoP